MSLYRKMFKRKVAPNVGLNNAKNRELWLERTLRELPTGLRILDAGAGECQFRKYCGHLEYVSQDLSQYDGSGDGAGLQTGTWDTSKIDIVSDVCSIPQPDASFDVILCTEVLEHIPEPVAALKEFSRLLKHEGRLIITAPFCSLTHFAPFHFSTGFNRYFYEHHLMDLGFDSIELDANGNFFEYVAQELRRVSEVAARYADFTLEKKHIKKIEGILEMLDTFARKDKGSDQLLNHGYHVTAIRKR
ncbi:MULTISPECIES: class I SAM-dependent methyltransferase [Pannonibacter]|uniref:class I SAM-dependent methyltransferase n=1 Tax=Pannonibacter TaxID=227873 RepID=UPI00197DEFBA|nr:class I SAM-dependent methyltransferase [Pannonibacter phragmitetus]